MEKGNCIEKPCFAELLAGIRCVSRSLGETDLETNLKEQLHENGTTYDTLEKKNSGSKMARGAKVIAAECDSQSSLPGAISLTDCLLTSMSTVSVRTHTVKYSIRFVKNDPPAHLVIEELARLDLHIYFHD